MLGRPKHVAITVLVGLASCAGASVPRTDVGHGWSREAEILAAAVRHLRSLGSGAMSIDPRPFRIDNEPYHLPNVSDYYEDAESVTRERSVVLRELGMKAARAFPLRAGCSGRLVPPSFRRTDGCPAETISEYAFDKVRPAPEPDRWLLRLISVYYTPRNVSATTYEMTIAAGDGGFVVERMVALVDFD